MVMETEEGTVMKISSCCRCNGAAVWVRNARLTGNTYYCSDHALKEPGFGQRTQSYFDWEKLFDLQVAQKHALMVPEYEDLSVLAEAVHNMRYDKVEEFYGHCATELDEQASRDWAKGRVQLSMLLDEAAEKALEQQELFARIWALCEPHMQTKE